MTTAMIIDCHGLGWIAAYTTGALTYNKKPTGIMYGFFRQLLKACTHVPAPDVFIFAWDSQKSLRKRIFPEYKAHRRVEDKSPADKILREQVSIQLNKLRGKVLPSLGFRNQLQHTGYEADDIIASIVKSNIFDSVTIVSDDNDMLQLLTDDVSIFVSRKDFIYTKEDFIRVHNGLTPDRWNEVKALAGCTSDNVPGIYRVGEGYAVKYLTGDLKKGKVYDRITEGILTEEYQRDYKLVTLPFSQLEFSIEMQETILLSEFNVLCRSCGFASFLSPGSQAQFREKMGFL